MEHFKPSANHTVGTAVPVWYDALGILMFAWDLSAVQ
jgi:hypothetical protein